jgi:hypothetical protein
VEDADLFQKTVSGIQNFSDEGKFIQQAIAIGGIFQHEVGNVLMIHPRREIAVELGVILRRKCESLKKIRNGM